MTRGPKIHTHTSPFNAYNIMPRYHLPRTSYDLFIYDFPYYFSGIVDGYKLRRRMCSHSLRSPCDFFRRQMGTKTYRDLTEIVQKPHSHRVPTTSAQKSHGACAMALRKSHGVDMLIVGMYTYRCRNLIFLFASNT